MNQRLPRLRAELASDRLALITRLDELAGISLATSPTDAGDLARVAVALHHAYSAFETIMLRLAREFEGEPPPGPDWHQSLLAGMSLEIPGMRPAVISPPSHAALRIMLGFRHFFRHAYAVALDAGQLETLRARAVASRLSLLGDLHAIETFIDGLGQDDEP